MAYTGLDVKIILERSAQTVMDAPTYGQRRKVQEALRAGIERIEELEVRVAELEKKLLIFTAD